VKAALERPSVYDSFLRYLAGKGYDVPDEALERDVTQPVAESKGVQAALLDAYRDDGEPAQVAERLVDFDEGFMEWRYHHVKMVERTIGTRQGTRISNGSARSRRRSGCARGFGGCSTTPARRWRLRRTRTSSCCGSYRLCRCGSGRSSSPRTASSTRCGASSDGSGRRGSKSCGFRPGPSRRWLSGSPPRLRARVLCSSLRCS